MTSAEFSSSDPIWEESHRKSFIQYLDQEGTYDSFTVSMMQEWLRTRISEISFLSEVFQSDPEAKNNCAAILFALAFRPGMKNIELRKKLGIDGTTVNRNTRFLESESLLSIRMETSPGGKQTHYYKLDEAGVCLCAFLGVDSLTLKARLDETVSRSLILEQL